jgi:acetoin utilization protein AcuC
VTVSLTSSVLKSNLIKELNAKTQYPATTTVLVHSDQYANWIFDPTHPTQGRRFINAHTQFIKLLKEDAALFTEVEPRLATRAELERVHAPSYIDEVLENHLSGQWSGKRADLASLASTFVGGTLVALDALLSKKALTAIHFPGSKHHAQYDHSSGFCIFNDFAIAADIATKDYGLRVAILDIDAHHGDGVENLTADNPMVLTYSIHEKGIFPGTGNESDPDRNIYNFPLVPKDVRADSPGKGNEALEAGVTHFMHLVDAFKADLIFITCGADGHKEDPLSSLEYSVEGYEGIAKLLRSRYPDTPMLLGGAGGYLPDTRTPEVWSHFTANLAVS